MKKLLLPPLPALLILCEQTRCWRRTQSLLLPRIPNATGTWAWIFSSRVYSSNPLGPSPVLRIKLGKLGPAGKELLAAAGIWRLF